MKNNARNADFMFMYVCVCDGDERFENRDVTIVHPIQPEPQQQQHPTETYFVSFVLVESDSNV